MANENITPTILGDIQLFQDGERANAENLNRPIVQLSANQIDQNRMLDEIYTTLGGTDTNLDDMQEVIDKLHEFQATLASDDNALDSVQEIITASKLNATNITNLEGSLAYNVATINQEISDTAAAKATADAATAATLAAATLADLEATTAALDVLTVATAPGGDSDILSQHTRAMTVTYDVNGEIASYTEGDITVSDIVRNVEGVITSLIETSAVSAKNVVTEYDVDGKVLSVTISDVV